MKPVWSQAVRTEAYGLASYSTPVQVPGAMVGSPSTLGLPRAPLLLTIKHGPVGMHQSFSEGTWLLEKLGQEVLRSAEYTGELVLRGTWTSLRAPFVS